MTDVYLSDAAMERIDREFARMMRRRDQQLFEATLAPPPVISSDYVDPELLAADARAAGFPEPPRFRYWPPEIVRAFWKAPLP
jgi:hypothetical protein